MNRITVAALTITSITYPQVVLLSMTLKIWTVSDLFWPLTSIKKTSQHNHLKWFPSYSLRALQITSFVVYWQTTRLHTNTLITQSLSSYLEGPDAWWNSRTWVSQVSLWLGLFVPHRWDKTGNLYEKNTG